MKKQFLSMLFLTAFFTLASCGAKNSDNSNKLSALSSTEVEETAEATADNATTIDGIDKFVDWDFGIMNVSKDGDVFVLSKAKGDLQLRLKPTGKGTYQEISGSRVMLGQGARYVAEKVGDVTTLTAFSDKTILFTLLSYDGELTDFRDRGYKRMLTSRFEPTENGVITITEDTMKGPILPDSPDIDYFFVEDGEGDLTEFIRLSPGRFHLCFSPADKGVNLHDCTINPETGDFDVNYDREYSICLHYADEPGWTWLSTDVLDAAYLIFNFDKPYWKVMLDTLKGIKKPNEVERWNKKILENLIKYNEPYTGLGSSDY